MKKLQNKVALVTGGSRGIGKAVVYALAAEGANVGINYVKTKEKAEQVCEDVRKKHSVKAITIGADVSQQGDVQRMMDTMVKQFGTIDILVNNAGVAIQSKVVDTSVEEWHRMLATDLTGVFLCTKAVLPLMLKRKQGRIINVGSVYAQVGAAEFSAYSAAKGGVHAFTKAVALEVAREGIQVNCIAPGPVLTDIAAERTEEWRQARAALLPMGRFVMPEEVAPAVVFLASADGNSFTGQTICPNCGDVMI